MIYTRIIRNEVARKKGAMLVVFAFILLASLLVAGGAALIVELNSSLNRLFADAKAPHFVQMHTGEIDPAAVDAWAEGNSLVDEFQIAEMVSVDGSSLFLSDSEAPQENSIMDISFVAQNERFDYLLDMDNRRLDLEPGEIGVPVYYAEEKGVGAGDRVTVAGEGYSHEYTVTSLVRDAQMNPAIVHSKRFLLNAADFERLKADLPDREFLVEFRLTDPSRIDEFSSAYEDSALPQRGPAVDYQLFKILNALSDGIVAAVVIILSLVLMVIAGLCLRFTILATVEEDYREIGVMKAVGMPRGRIKGIYLAKYVALGGSAAALGYLASLPLTSLVTGNIARYMGRAPQGAAGLVVPILAAATIFAMVVVSAMLVLRRFDRVSAVEALRAEARSEAPPPGRVLPLSAGRLFDINVFLGMRDALQRFRLFGLLTFVFFFAAGITLIPLHFLSTIRSPSFISYMGIGSSDIRVDLRQSDDIDERFEEVVEHIAADSEVARFAPLVTSLFTMVGENGETERLAVETGDFSVFPLDYLHGKAPRSHDEIALSYLNARDLDKKVGDTVTLRSGGGGGAGAGQADLRGNGNAGGARDLPMRVTGIYQDVTDGGRTAKAVLPPNRENLLASTVSLDVAPGTDVAAKMREYSELFAPARVTDLRSYLSQTLGNTIDGLVMVTAGATAVGMAVAVLITSLFLRMLISKDSKRIAVMKSIGFSLRSLRVQYLTTALVLLVIGIGAGSLFSNTIGQRLVGFVWGFMGASQIRFVIDPLQAYLIMPLLLMLTVAITTMVSIRGIKEQSIAATIAE
ncbi:MAG: ABC transporter permease [Spirochaetia bacterium]